MRWSLFTILFVILLNFFLFRILPGVPAQAGDIQIMVTIVFAADVLG
jgi:hypothetical protein